MALLGAMLSNSSWGLVSRSNYLGARWQLMPRSAICSRAGIEAGDVSGRKELEGVRSATNTSRNDADPFDALNGS